MEYMQNMRTVYPCGQLLTLLLLGDEVLGGHLELKLGQLMFPAHCPARTKRITWHHYARL